MQLCDGALCLHRSGNLSIASEQRAALPNASACERAIWGKSVTSTTAMATRAHTLHNLQVLRALAAFLVLYHHYIDYPQIAIDDWYGAVGVDIFFVISGFVITYAQRGSALDFSVRRIIRIAPLYWALTILWVVLAMVFRISGSGLTPESITFSLVLRSLFFIPDEPIITRGWTLNFEMYFYLLFAISMLMSRRWTALICLVLVGSVFTLVNLTNPGRPWNFYGSVHVFQFLAGSAAFYSWRAIGRSERAKALVRRWRHLVLATCVALFAACCWSSDYWRNSSLVGVTLTSALFVFAVVTLEEYGRVYVRSQLLTLLGDASYSIYLVHRFIYAPLARTAFPLLVDQPVWVKLLAFLPLAVLVLIVSVGVHLAFERPVTRWLGEIWRRASGRPPSQATVAAVEWGKDVTSRR